MGTELLSQYEIPYLHPLVVHFPFVLLLLAAGCAAVYGVIGRRVWRRAVSILLLFAVPAAWLSVQSGKDLRREVEGEPMVEIVVEAHETAAVATLWTSIVAFLVVGGLGFWVERRRFGELHSLDVGELREPIAARALVFLVALVPAVLVAHTAHLGGLMVWGIPVGG